MRDLQANRIVLGPPLGCHPLANAESGADNGVKAAPIAVLQPALLIRVEVEGPNCRGAGFGENGSAGYI